MPLPGTERSLYGYPAQTVLSSARINKTDVAVWVGWTVRGSNHGGGDIFLTVQTGPGADPPPIQRVPGLSWG
jgi:hypothetical protein